MYTLTLYTSKYVNIPMCSHPRLGSAPCTWMRLENDKEYLFFLVRVGLLVSAVAPPLLPLLSSISSDSAPPYIYIRVNLDIMATTVARYPQDNSPRDISLVLGLSRAPSQPTRAIRRRDSLFTSRGVERDLHKTLLHIYIL